jgi:hypothetical protein
MGGKHAARDTLYLAINRLIGCSKLSPLLMAHGSPYFDRYKPPKQQFR